MKPPREKPATRDVYVVGDKRGRKKIGVSNDAERRLTNLQTGNGDDLTKVHVEKTAYHLGTKVERTARAILMTDHTHKREWINNCSDEDAINAVRTAHEYHRGRNK